MLPGEIRRHDHIAIQGGRGGQGIVVIKVVMALVPPWTETLGTFVYRMVGLDSVVGIVGAKIRRRQGGITAGDARDGAWRRIELRQAVEFLHAVLPVAISPVLGQSAKVLQEAAILLGHEDDVIDGL